MELKGNIKDFPLPDIVQLVSAGRKTGMLSIAFKKHKASLYFKGGKIIHASMLNNKGKAAILKMFHLVEGGFHFYANIAPESETLNEDPTSILMEAMSSYDEKRKEQGFFDKSGKKGKAHAKKIATLKMEITKIITDLYGKKAKKIVQLIKKCGDSEIELLSSCDKIEKYIFVFLDSQNSKIVADKMRFLIEETH